MTVPRNPQFAALRHRNFRLIWIGQLVSMAGSMMQNAAILWHVSVLVEPSRRGLALGLVGLVRVAPIVAFSLVAGVVADAHDRRRLMLVTQTGMAVAAALLAWTAFAGVRQVWPIYVLAAIAAAFGTFDNPARQALIPTLVPAADLPNAIGLNAIMFQTASVVGPAAGGVLIGEFGIGWAYFFLGGPQLGELEAGLVASAWGPVFSVVSGGLGCLLVTGLIAARTPQLRQYRASIHPTPRGALGESGS
jgi:MFS family permease